MVGCSAPYREAIEQRVSERGRSRMTSDLEAEVKLIQCDSDRNWDLLAGESARGCIVVAVLPSPLMEDYVRALVAGAAGVVPLDTSSTITAAVIEAATHGEVVLPRQAAQNLALLAQRTKPPTNLSIRETDLLRAVATGTTIADVAREQYFSERTVRRHLQSLYLKLGVRNRTEAIAAATRMGIVD